MTIRGEQPLKFGTTAITGYIVMEDIDKEDMADSVTIEDEDGDIVTDISGLTKRGSVKLTVVPNEDVVPPDVDDEMTVGVDGANITFVIDKISVSNKKKTASTWSIEGHYNPATLA